MFPAGLIRSYQKMTVTGPKIRAARLSIGTAAFLALVKLAAGLFTGSLAMLASAVDSVLDILMSGVNYLAIRQAEQPADESHPFGHGKFETLATLIQSLFIALSGGWIVFESIHRLIRGADLSHLEGGALVLAGSSLASWLISRHLRKVAAATDSSALQADALHFSMDVYTNLALGAGLIAVRFFQASWLDPVLSLLVAFYILYEALHLVRHGLRDVLDTELPEPLRREVERLIEAHHQHIHGYHNLRTRRAGSQKIMDFHLTVCKHLSVEEAHAIADHLEKRIEEEIKGSDVTIHIEPCREEGCPGMERCPFDRSRFEPDH